MAKRTGAARKPQSEDEEALLLRLVEEAGQASARAGEARRAYDRKREQLAAMMGRLRQEGDVVQAGGFSAVLERDREQFIDAAALDKALKSDRATFYAIVRVTLGAAKAALTPEAFGDLVRTRLSGRPKLKVRAAGVPAGDDDAASAA